MIDEPDDKPPEVLVVDDTPANLQVLCEALAPAGYEILVATSGAAALKTAARARPDLILLDVMMPDVDGYQTCRRLKASAETCDIPVIFITAHTDRQNILEGFRLGGVDYITKPVDKEEVLARVRTHLEINRLHKVIADKNRDLEAQNLELQRKNRELEAEMNRRRQAEAAHQRADAYLERIAQDEAAHWGIEGLVGHSATMRRIHRETQQLQDADVSGVLILGESGTGKELIARALHAGSRRCTQPFVPVNCAAIPLELAESFFFGHVKGAFTGAVGDRQGYFTLADGGTLFLDELGEMPLELQAKLLRVLEDGVIQPVGRADENAVDVRILAATNALLSQRAADGQFRQDLYFRLARFVVEIPPLRERREDIPLLAEHFLRIFAEEMNVHRPVLSAEALVLLETYDFPGNVRELKNLIEHALIKSQGGRIEPENLHFLTSVDPVPPVIESLAAGDEQQILAYVDAHGSIDNTGCRRLLGVNRNRAKYLLEKLCQSGQLRRVGQSRSTRYSRLN